MKNYEEATAFLGQWGRFQQVNFFLLCASAVQNGLTVFVVVFMAATPRHHCLIPDGNLTREWISVAIPTESVNGQQELSKCSRYRLDVIQNLSDQGLLPGRDVNVTELERENCLNGWNYSKDFYQSTIVTEYDLVCSDQWKQPLTATVFFFGVLIGSFLAGQLSDKFGRKVVLFLALALQSVAVLLQIFSPSWTVFCIFFFMNGLGRSSSYNAGFVLGTEILTGRVRVLFSSMAMCVGFAIGYMLLPLFAYLLREWKFLLFAIFLSGLMYLPLWWVIPESPRWLLSQGRVEEAEAIVKKASKSNKVEAPQLIFEDYSVYGVTRKGHPMGHHNMLHLLKTTNIRNITFILSLTWFTISTAYYSLSLNTSELHADPFLSCFISAAVEIPAYICIWLALRYLRRRFCLLCILFLGAASLFLIRLIPEDLSYLSLSLEMLGKFAITGGTSMMYAYVSELYPTVLRNTATGTCSISPRVGVCIAPFLFKLKIYSQHLPYIVLGTLAVLSAIAAYFLPETYGKPLPQNIQDMSTCKRSASGRERTNEKLGKNAFPEQRRGTSLLRTARRWSRRRRENGVNVCV
ncbi:solute carrier family 22 member 5-like isoform X1 [Takifugu rubripes]|uniref:solute carrier family 22 member 5-like isoform X1 n=1 Tax=Takifugu rubripes TaxID=31033 RepID=UPI001145F1C4|nr:solute carrier family 22 member 5-like isoform X1 [Takifugu rubripes]